MFCSLREQGKGTYPHTFCNLKILALWLKFTTTIIAFVSRVFNCRHLWAVTDCLILEKTLKDIKARGAFGWKPLPEAEHQSAGGMT